MKVLMIKAVCRCHDVGNARVRDAARGKVLERRSAAGAMRRYNSSQACGRGDAMVIVSESFC